MPLRLPYRVDRVWNRAALALGSRERLLRCNGFVFRVRRLSSDEAFVTNVVERREYLQHGITIRPTDTVVDIGGNIGTFAVLASSMASRVVTVEPDPDNLRLLRTNLALNRCSNVVVVAAAVVGTPRTVTLHRSAEGGGYHTVLDRYDRDFSDAIHVQGITLADVFAAHEIDCCHLLKLDCEGTEHDIVASAPSDVLARIDQVAMEYHTPPGLGLSIAPLRDRLIAHGLRVLHDDCFGARGGHLFLSRHGASP